MIKQLAPSIREQVRRLLPTGSEDDDPTTAATEAAAAAATTTLLVVRHGHAGDREKWDGPDERRPLSKKGHRQATGLVEALESFDVSRIVSSRYVRCLESVVPLACARRLGIEVHPALAEGSSVTELSDFLAGVGGTTTVLCTHGDVIWNLVVELAHQPRDLPMAKGSTWVVEGQGGGGQGGGGQGGRLTSARYLPPPTPPN